MSERRALRSWFSPALLGLHLLGVVAVASCVVMGLWQLGVYDSRQEHERADRREVPRVELTTLWQPDQAFTPRLNHRPVSAVGTFAPASDQFWVTGKEQAGRTGAWLVAPLVVDGGDAALLVVRGWSKATGPLPPVPTGKVSVEGVLEPGEGSAGAMDEATREIGSVRLPALINVLPYDLYSGFAVNTDADVADGLALVPPPEPGDITWTVGVRNLAYALQWWVFGLFAAFMWWRMSAEVRTASLARVA